MQRHAPSTGSPPRRMLPAYGGEAALRGAFLSSLKEAAVVCRGSAQRVMEMAGGAQASRAACCPVKCACPCCTELGGARRGAAALGQAQGASSAAGAAQAPTAPCRARSPLAQQARLPLHAHSKSCACNPCLPLQEDLFRQALDANLQRYQAILASLQLAPAAQRAAPPRLPLRLYLRTDAGGGLG